MVYPHLIDSWDLHRMYRVIGGDLGRLWMRFVYCESATLHRESDFTAGLICLNGTYA